MTNAADIVFKYRQTVTRSFQHLQGDYYIAPAFMVSVFALSLSIKRLAYCGIGRVNLSDFARNIICCSNALLEFKHVYLQLDMCHGSHRNLKPKPLVASECIKKVSGYGDECKLGFAIMKVQYTLFYSCLSVLRKIQI